MTQSGELSLGVPGFTYPDLFVPARLAALHGAFDAWFRANAPTDYAQFDAYRASRGEGMTPLAKSEALLAAAPHVGAFVAKLFRIEPETDTLRSSIRADDPLWVFKRDFAKKRVLKADALPYLDAINALSDRMATPWQAHPSFAGSLSFVHQGRDFPQSYAA